MTYHFRLQCTDGSSADPPTYRSTVLTWRQGDAIPLTADRSLRVLGVRDDDADQPPVLIVEAMPRTATTGAARHPPALHDAANWWMIWAVKWGEKGVSL